jgi:hypothetical protein
MITQDWAGAQPCLGLYLRQILLSFISCQGGWSQTFLQVKKPDVEVLGWLVGRNFQIFIKQRWRRLMVEKLTFNSLATSLVKVPAVNMPITRSIVLWDETAF